MEKISETQSWLFEKINKIDKPMAKPTKKREKTHTDNIKWRWGHNYWPTDIKRIIKEYEKLFVQKFDNLDEIGQFLERHKVLQPMWEEIKWIASYMLKKWINN